MVKLVMRVARVAPKRARCFNSKGTSFHVVLELEHVKPVDQRSAIRKADAVLPAFTRAGQHHDTLKRVAQRGRCRLLFLFGVKHVGTGHRRPCPWPVPRAGARLPRAVGPLPRAPRLRDGDAAAAGHRHGRPRQPRRAFSSFYTEVNTLYANG